MWTDLREIPLKVVWGNSLFDVILEDIIIFIGCNLLANNDVLPVNFIGNLIAVIREKIEAKSEVAEEIQYCQYFLPIISRRYNNYTHGH